METLRRCVPVVRLLSSLPFPALLTRCPTRHDIAFTKLFQLRCHFLPPKRHMHLEARRWRIWRIGHVPFTFCRLFSLELCHDYNNTTSSVQDNKPAMCPIVTPNHNCVESIILMTECWSLEQQESCSHVNWRFCGCGLLASGCL